MYKVTVPPSVEPVTLAEAKVHLRFELEDEDALITRLIKSAREQCEHKLDRAIGAQTIVMSADVFEEKFRLPRAIAESVTSVTYKDADGVSQTVSSSVWELNADSDLVQYVQLKKNQTWPSGDQVKITYVTSGVVTESIKEWILLVLATAFENRESASDSKTAVQDNSFFHHLIDSNWRAEY